MNLQAFFEHWKILENPFRGEEARQDPVFLRLEAAGPVAQQTGAGGVTTHSDFEKIAGDFTRPSSAIVFGEKGSGKTAIRLQLADRIAAHNAAHPASRCLLVAYDELNPILDRFHDRTATERKPNTAEVLAKFRLVDHIDAILSLIVPRIVDTLLKERQDEAADAQPAKSSSAVLSAAQPAGSLSPPSIDLGPEPRRVIRRAEPALRYELLLLQSIYDRPERAHERTGRLRRVLRLPMPMWPVFCTTLALIGWIFPAALIAWAWNKDLLKPEAAAINYAIAALVALYLLVLAKRSIWDRLAFIRLGHRLRRQVRILPRGDASLGRSLRQLPAAWRDPALLPVTKSDEQRYAMVERLRRILRLFGYSGLVIVIDRVDEPTLISGDPERMRSVIWPMLNNKFLQQEGVGVKMLLPMELRHALFRESAAFFQEARLDKQNLIERLAWTGAMLYDLCNARLQACRAKDAQDQISLLDLFAEDVTRQDLVDALDQMHQPRDAFKMLYQCLSEHCSNVTQEQAQWRIPRLVLDTVRKQQAERVRQLYSGVRPA